MRSRFFVVMVRTEFANRSDPIDGAKAVQRSPASLPSTRCGAVEAWRFGARKQVNVRAVPQRMGSPEPGALLSTSRACAGRCNASVGAGGITTRRWRGSEHRDLENHRRWNQRIRTAPAWTTASARVTAQLSCHAAGSCGCSRWSMPALAHDEHGHDGPRRHGAESARSARDDRNGGALAIAARRNLSAVEKRAGLRIRSATATRRRRLAAGR